MALKLYAKVGIQTPLKPWKCNYVTLMQPETILIGLFSIMDY